MSAWKTVRRVPLAGWMGGKRQLAGRIIAAMPEHECYVEAFAGAAWVFFSKPESRVEVLNDINREVVTLYRVAQHHLEEFVRYFKWALVSRDEFSRLKACDPDTLTDIQRAARFYYLQQSCFGGRIHRPAFGYGTTHPPRLNLLRIEEDLSAAHLRLARTYLECLPYGEVIRRYDKPVTFFYLDPPYLGCEDYYGQGIFGREDFEALAAQLSNLSGKFLLSLNDSPEIRKVFSAFEIESVTVNYSCTNGPNLKAREVLVRNF